MVHHVRKGLNHGRAQEKYPSKLRALRWTFFRKKELILVILQLTDRERVMQMSIAQEWRLWKRPEHIKYPWIKTVSSPRNIFEKGDFCENLGWAIIIKGIKLSPR